jgi:hypothetical protein
LVLDIIDAGCSHTGSTIRSYSFEILNCTITAGSRAINTNCRCKLAEEQHIELEMLAHLLQSRKSPSI